MISKNIEFDFDDILIVPTVNIEITSRYVDIVLPDVLPLFTAPMDTVVNLDNMDDFMDNKIQIALPRTISYDQFKNHVHNENMQFYSDIFISMGFDEINKHHNENHFEIFHKNAHILIDVANGHMLKVMDFAKKIKLHRPDIKIMVGNIANPETYLWYAENNCVDYIRVGIGNGGGCLTTKQSGVGHPMASLIHEVRQVKLLFVYDQKIAAELNEKNPNSIIKRKIIKAPAIVADGGMKDYSDVIKALALGADYVMLGSILNKALESAGSNYLYKIKLNNRLARYFYDKDYPIKKYFRGMSTKEAQKAMGKTQIKTSEGIVRYRRVEYHLDGWIENFQHYLRNAMSYANAKNLENFIGKVDICQITKNAYDRFNK
ncbi:MAG: IMP dehydrogenase [Candidatus Paceibacterota bacterium]